jgi:hypothetical protein
MNKRREKAKASARIRIACGGDTEGHLELGPDGELFIVDFKSAWVAGSNGPMTLDEFNRELAHRLPEHSTNVTEAAMPRDPADQIEKILHDGKDVLSRIATVLGMDQVEAQRNKFRASLQRIAAMDPDGKRADDLGRAAREARHALRVPSGVEGLKR